MGSAGGTTATATTAIDLPREAIEALCRRWQITALESFGSILRDDFGPESDDDFLITFALEARWTPFDLVDLEAELERSENWIRRRSILETVRPFHAAE